MGWENFDLVWNFSEASYLEAELLHSSKHTQSSGV